ncbi:transposase [Nonomuraea angiospora]|uniref:transposase n=1 Tax=Nonomuraea angiospora TaxID=46172 RepID=UPI003404BC34
MVGMILMAFAQVTDQGLSPPKGRSWAPIGPQPVVTVRGKGTGRVNVPSVVAYRNGERPHHSLHAYHRGRKGEPRSLSWISYRDLIVASHQHLGAPLVWYRKNLNVHLAGQGRRVRPDHADWLSLVQLPAYAPDLTPVEGVRPLLRRTLANFVVGDLRGRVRIVKRKLKKIQ